MAGQVEEVSRRALLELASGLGIPPSTGLELLEQVLQVASQTRSALSAAGRTGSVSQQAAVAVEASVRRLERSGPG